jgi:hypothetical protein
VPRLRLVEERLLVRARPGGLRLFGLLLLDDRRGAVERQVEQARLLVPASAAAHRNGRYFT